LRTAQGKKVSKTLSQKNKPGMAVHVCNPNYMRGVDRRVMDQNGPWTKNMRTYLKK
jgi:hypothetical protein